MTKTTLEQARELDKKDPLAKYKSQFSLPEGVIYMDGNSLGAQPTKARESIEGLMDQWRDQLIKGWNQGWWDAPERLGKKLAPVIGASEDEVIVTDAITINLYKLIGYCVSQAPKDRRAVLSESGNFPTDAYIAQGFCKYLDIEHRFLPEGADIAEHLDGVGVVVLSQVRYRDGNLRDMEETTRIIHEHGAEVIWDLAHSAGALPVELNATGANYAVGCTYKYLNGGPGGPGFIYVRREKQNEGWQPLSGWHGHTEPFAFTPDYVPSKGMTHFRVGTHSALAYYGLEPSLDMWKTVDLQEVRKKSLALNDLFRDNLADLFEKFNIEDITPEAKKRGSQASLINNEIGFPVVQAMIARGVIGDYREPGLMRFGFTPLYLSYEDVWQAAQHMREVLESGEYKEERFNVRSAVT